VAVASWSLPPLSLARASGSSRIAVITACMSPRTPLPLLAKPRHSQMWPGWITLDQMLNQDLTTKGPTLGWLKILSSACSHLLRAESAGSA